MQRLKDPQALVAIGLIVVAVAASRHLVDANSLLLFALLIPSVVLHEVSHGVAALAFGDDTAQRAGRLNLNPARHVDPVGTLIIPAVLALSGSAVFGYAKPVPVNPGRMRHPRNDSLAVSLAGPACNLVLAALAVIALRVFAHPSGFVALGSWSTATRVVFLFGFVNVTLAVFNALPIPPLDGSAVLERLLPPSALPGWYSFTRCAMPVLMVVMLLGGGLLGHLFSPAERAYANLVLA